MSNLDRLIAPWAEIIPYPVHPHPGQTALLGVPLLAYSDRNKVWVPLLPLGPDLALTTTWALSDIEYLPHSVGRTLLLPQVAIPRNLRVLWARNGWRHIAPSPYLETSEEVVLFAHPKVRIAVIPGRVGNVLKTPDSFYPEKYNFLPSHKSTALVYMENPYQAQLRIAYQGELAHHWKTPLPGPVTVTNFLDKLTARIGRTLKRSGVQVFAERALCP